MSRQAEACGSVMLGGLAVCGLAGCGSPYECQKGVVPEPSGPPRVTLSAGDVLDVRFFFTPELNVTQTVRPDGKISLQLVGEVSVEGKSPCRRCGRSSWPCINPT